MSRFFLLVMANCSSTIIEKAIRIMFLKEKIYRIRNESNSIKDQLSKCFKDKHFVIF